MNNYQKNWILPQDIIRKVSNLFNSGILTTETISNLDYSGGMIKLAKKKNTLLLATVAAGAYAYFSKKENRDKAQVAFNNMKTKVDAFIDTQKTNRAPETKVGHSDPYDIDDNKMVSEGAQTSVHYYNQEVQDEQKSKEDLDGLYTENRRPKSDETNSDESFKQQ